MTEKQQLDIVDTVAADLKEAGMAMPKPKLETRLLDKITAKVSNGNPITGTKAREIEQQLDKMEKAYDALCNQPNDDQPIEQQFYAEDVAEAKSKFADPDLINEIHAELDKDHVGDHKEKMALFLAGVSALLPSENRISVALKGGTSAGKDSCWQAVGRHMPKGKLLCDVTRITASSIEDDISKYSGIYIGEGNFNRENGSYSAVVEHIKQLAESGTHVIKKDVTKNNKEKVEHIQERKSIFYSTTDVESDDELSTRFVVISFRSSAAKTGRINAHIANNVSSVEAALNALQRKSRPSWIEIGLTELMNDAPDLIIIPYMQFIPVANDNPRAARDLKRFINFVKVLAFLHTDNRPNMVVKQGNDEIHILFAAPEDLRNAYEITGDLFAQTYSGVEARLEQTIEMLQMMVKKGSTVALRTMGDDGFIYEPGLVDRADLQKEMGLSLNSVKKILAALKGKGIIDVTYGVVENRPSKRVLIRLKPEYTGEGVTEGVKKPFLRCQDEEFFSKISDYYPSILLTASHLIDSFHDTFKIVDMHHKTNVFRPKVSHFPTYAVDTTPEDLLTAFVAQFDTFHLTPSVASNVTNASAVSEQKTPGPVFAMPTPANASEVQP